ncbi:MAG: hypothetical protein BWZ02_02467 [Lentisphaerae bacterium ADurb.BinA184]|nr:MAG: hypothetical protein BWZ02_02467 [Lentisphaerae bacterium ADurb.BinA184]
MVKQIRHGQDGQQGQRNEARRPPAPCSGTGQRQGGQADGQPRQQPVVGVAEDLRVPIARIEAGQQRREPRLRGGEAECAPPVHVVFEPGGGVVPRCHIRRQPQRRQTGRRQRPASCRGSASPHHDHRGTRHDHPPDARRGPHALPHPDTLPPRQRPRQPPEPLDRDHVVTLVSGVGQLLVGRRKVEGQREQEEPRHRRQRRRQPAEMHGPGTVAQRQNPGRAQRHQHRLPPQRGQTMPGLVARPQVDGQRRQQERKGEGGSRRRDEQQRHEPGGNHPWQRGRQHCQRGYPCRHRNRQQADNRGGNHDAPGGPSVFGCSRKDDDGVSSNRPPGFRPGRGTQVARPQPAGPRLDAPHPRPRGGASHGVIGRFPRLHRGLHASAPPGPPRSTTHDLRPTVHVAGWYRLPRSSGQGTGMWEAPPCAEPCTTYELRPTIPSSARPHPSLNRRIANSAMRSSSQPCRQRRMLVTPYRRDL